MEIIKKQIINNTYVLKIREELDLYSSGEFSKYIEDEFNSGYPEGIILDFETLEYIDSSGIGALLSLRKECLKNDCLLVLSSLEYQVREVLKLTNLLRIFNIAKSENEAVKYIYQVLKKKEKKDNGGPIIVNDRHPNFNTEGLKSIEVNADFNRIRRISSRIVMDAPESIKDYNILEQQVSEIVKNAVRHGNKNDITKMVKIWWNFTPQEARLVVLDEGEGFKRVDEWNSFHRKRAECFKEDDLDKVTDYLSYRTEESRPEDGGNALFAAVEFWNGGYVLNSKGNAVALKKIYSS